MSWLIYRNPRQNKIKYLSIINYQKMKNLFESHYLHLVLGTLYFALSTVFALCTLTSGQYTMLRRSIMYDCYLMSMFWRYDRRLNANCDGSSITGDNSWVPSTAISGSMITFRFTVASFSGDKYFVLRLPWTTNYSIQYLTSSLVPDNNATIASDRDPYLLFIAEKIKQLQLPEK